MAPKSWIALSFLMTTFSLAIIMEPLAKLAVIIIGSISGVSPTPTLKAKTPASSQSPSVNPFAKNTIGTMTSIKRIKSQEMLFISRSKEVGSS